MFHSDPDTVRRVVRNFRVHVPMAGIVDRAKEIERVQRELAKLSKQRSRITIATSELSFCRACRSSRLSLTQRTQEERIGQRQAQLEQILAELSG